MNIPSELPRKTLFICPRRCGKTQALIQYFTMNSEKSILYLGLVNSFCHVFQGLANVRTRSIGRWNGEFSGVDLICLEEPFFMQYEEKLRVLLSSDCNIMAIGTRWIEEENDLMYLSHFISNGFTIIEC